MNISDIYKSFQTPPNLQEHMLRVAALAEVIIDNWREEFPSKKDVIHACLLHDIAKPMRFDLEKQAEFGLSSEKIRELANLQVFLRENYSSTEHAASVAICKEVGCSDLAAKLVDNLEWIYAQRFLDMNDILSLLPIYCDMRVAPNGVMPLSERLNELRERDPNMDNFEKVGLDVQSVIQKKVSIDLNQITDEEVNLKIQVLRQFEI